MRNSSEAQKAARGPRDEGGSVPGMREGHGSVKPHLQELACCISSQHPKPECQALRFGEE